MCGGIRFTYDPALEPVLATIYTPEQLATQRETGTVTTLFWQPQPVLPVVRAGKLELCDWGNRGGGLRLPPTGWVRQESLAAGKWDYLRPQEVTIPAFQGVERNVWFTIEQGITGYLVERDGAQRVYMLTVAPTEAYRALTGHDRMPALIGQTEVVPLNPPQQQRTLGL